MDLSGQKILFIGPKYYDYHIHIVQTLANWGANVDYYPEMVNDFSQRAAKIIKGAFAKWVQQRYNNALIEKIKDKEYDLFLLIRGEIITPECVEQIKRFSPNARCIMYQWDSLKHNDYRSKIPLFDTVMTFDPQDAIALKLDYLPLFYRDDYAKLRECHTAKEYDIVFFGAYHSDRLDIIKVLTKEAARYGLKFYHHLYITRFSLLRGLMTRKLRIDDLKFLKTFTVGAQYVIDKYAQTKAVLDIEMSNQNGLTIRTLETLGANLKLITTNKTILKTPFFDPTRILFLDRYALALDLRFFDGSLKWDSRLEEYSLDSWLEKLISHRGNYNER